MGAAALEGLAVNWIVLFCALLSTPAARPAEGPTVLIVIGAEGESEYGSQFGRWADRWMDAAQRGGARALRIGGEGAPDEDKPKLKALLEAEAKVQGPLWLVLIGHGTFDGRDAKFNLRGPDLSGQELADWLKPATRPVAVINCTSASAPFLNKLSSQGRVIVTATRSGHEIYFARFGEHLSKAIGDISADLDKDGQTSLLEAFIAASHRVEEFYRQEGRLATEHALLDDNGDGLGIPASWFAGIRATKAARDGAALDGLRAHQWHLLRTAAEQAMSAELRARRDALEQRIEALRASKSSMSEAEYYAQLEAILIELARLYGTPSDAQ
jgi:hypothetical protein